MSYQVLARKWRPVNFDELVGQSHVLRALKSALDNDRLHHAYLFTGTRGVGKTTIARILARCLNCEEGVSSKPCGNCSACNEINEGRFVDLIEVDAASQRKVEDTQELLENVQYRPTRGRYKVYLIDEVHMLTNHSFNALLKTLEEPPPHVVFLLATTDPQKLPATVLSRCLQFHLKNMQPDIISNHLAHILTDESTEFDVVALESLAWSAKGSMRDALSLLDQAIAFGNGKVIESDVREMLGTIDRDQIYRIISAIANNDGAACMEIVEEMSQFSPDYEEALAEFLSVLHRIALIQQIPDVSMATQNQDEIAQLAAKISPEDVQLFYQLGLHGRRDLPLAPDMRSGFEMCMLRLMNFRPSQAEVPTVKKSEGSDHPVVKTVGGMSPTSVVIRQKNTEVTQNEHPVNDQNKPSAALSNIELNTSVQVDAPKIETSVALRSNVLISPLVRAQQHQEAVVSEEVTLNSGSVESAEVVEAPLVTDPEPMEESESLGTQEFSLPAVDQISPENWYCVIGLSNLKGVTQQIALNSQFMSFDGEHFKLSLTNNMRSMVHNEHINKLISAINALYSNSYTLSFSDKEPEFETPRQRKDKIRLQHHQHACDSLHNDPEFQGLLTTFDTQLDQDTVVVLTPEQS